MARQLVGIGAAPGDGTGDDLRTGADKINENFEELYLLQSETLNAGAFPGGTNHEKVQGAINQAVAETAERVYVPSALLPYNAALVTFSSAVQMVREGGDASVYDVRAYGAAGDDVQDDTAAIQAAMTAVAAQPHGGVVKLPAGIYRTSATLNLSFGVQVFGDGGTISVLKPIACHCLGLDVGLHGTGFGNLLLQNFGIDGTNCTAHTAVNNAGTLNEADQFYGLTLNKVMITNYNKAVNLRSIRNVLITGCWFQWVTTGIDMRGFNLVVRITENQIVQATAVGAGTNTGIILDRFNFSAGGGFKGPEGVQIINNQIFGFDTGISVHACNFCNLIANDIDAEIYGIEFSTAQNGFTVRDNYVAVTNAGSLAGIIGHGVASPYQSRANIDSNIVIGDSTVACVGIQINDSGNSNQDNVRIIGNLTTGLTVADIQINNGNSVIVRGNSCRSSVNPNIAIAGSTGPGPIVVHENDVLMGITNPGLFGASGAVDIGINTVAGVRVGARDTWSTPAFAAGNFTAGGSMTWTVAAGDVTTYAYALHNRRMTVAFAIITSTVGGTPHTDLRIAIPAGQVATKAMHAPLALALDNGTRVAGLAGVAAAGTVISLSKLDGTTWAAATDTTSVYGQITFEID